MSANMHLPLLPSRAWEPHLGTTTQKPRHFATAELLTTLQSEGLRLTFEPSLSRHGGAGPSDHMAVRLGGQVVMVPVFTHGASGSRFEARREGEGVGLYFEGQRHSTIDLPKSPQFYALKTASGIPYFQLATLHSTDVLATTVLQNCTRYGRPETACRFCAIGQSLSGKRTISRKKPEDLAEVAEAAVRLDGVSQMILTTGTPPTPDRGAQHLADVARAVTARVDLPIQAQCEPPEDPIWFERLRASGVRTLGMHLEAVTEAVRREMLPGKAELSVESYMSAFESAVRVFGRGQVTTYILAGLGDSAEEIVEMAQRLSRIGVYPFVVPFVPISGTPLQNHAPPSASFMADLLDRVSSVLAEAELSSEQASAGCGKCGACSTLKAREGAVGAKGEASHVG